LSSDICIFRNGQPDRDDNCIMFDSDGQQFKQRQQNEQSHHTFTHWTQKGPRHITFEIHVLAWTGTTYVTGVNWLMGF